MGRIKDLNSSLPGETDNLVFDGLNGTRRISYADFKQKLIDDGFGSGSSEAVVLTQAEYNALPDEVKDSDTIFFISDAPFDSPNVVTLTRAEYDALSTADKMDGRFYYVTDDAEVATSLVVQTNQNNPDTVPSSAVLYNEVDTINQTEWVRLETTRVENQTIPASAVMGVTYSAPSIAGYTWHIMYVNTQNSSLGVMDYRQNSCYIRNFTTAAVNFTLNVRWLGVKNTT